MSLGSNSITQNSCCLYFESAPSEMCVHVTPS
ncbi:MAG: (2Fe-2S)-binding protein [Clostridia bacterium]|nr:(2Fe-2S)-binding protein [Clostridia bacterium]